ncbi:MAG: hypothetical protein OXN25_13115, partial [Candidatus Poribacteria bacterium]|nr:hypothetical protein [Candidatus Poribacteria bacterium]
ATTENISTHFLILRKSYQEWKQAIKWFRGHAHLREDAFSIETYDEVEKHFQNLDNLLYAAAGSELEQLRSIHEILEEANE